MLPKNMLITSPVDGLDLSVFIIEPDEAPKAVLQIVHGMAEMKERYTSFMTYLAENGYACVIHDHRGHGDSVKSEEDLGYMYEGGGSSLVEDAHQVTLAAKKRWPGIPLILMGHSMGSLVVRCYTKKYDKDIDGLIVMGTPARNGAVGVAKVLAGISKTFKGGHHRSEFLNNLAFGSYLKDIPDAKTKNDWLSVNTDNVAFYNMHKKCGYTFTIDGFQGLFDVLEDTYSKKGWALNNATLPILFMSGEKDPCVNGRKNFDEAVQFMKDRGYNDTESIMYDGLRHEILNEDNRREIYEDIRKWMDGVISGE